MSNREKVRLIHYCNLVRERKQKMYNYENNSRAKMHAELMAARSRRAHRRVVEKYKRMTMPMIAIGIMAFVIMLLLPADMIGGGENYETFAFGVAIFAPPMLIGGIAIYDNAYRGYYDHEDFMYRRH